MRKKTMSFDDFIEAAKKLDVSICYGDPELYENRYGRFGNKNKKDKTPYIYVEYSTGGVSGGSCWDEGPANYTSYTSSEPPRDLEDFDIILEKICPNISFLTYKNITNSLIEHSTRTENEYYGNSSSYAMKKCNLVKLYNLLVEKDLI